jgi:chorismate mutase/prephenate dehydratase
VTTVAFQGEPGAYSESAVYQFFGSTVHAKPCRDFRDVFESVKRQDSRAGVVPVENSLEGSINQNYDLFFCYDLKVCGEVIVKVAHCLIVNPGTSIDQIKAVYSHPQALAQCRIYLEKMKWEIIPTYDTAGSVKIIKEQKLQNAAAIASERAAEIYGMRILARDIADNKENYTRFFVLSQQDSAPTGKDKTSIIFSAKHEPG